MRFRLLSKNVDENEIEECHYNHLNQKNVIPPIFFQKNDEIFDIQFDLTDLDKVKKICKWLQDNIKGGPGLSEASDVGLKLMLEGKGGVCSDFAQIFNNFCVINDLKVREWGLCRTPLSNDHGGHSFNEFYSKELKKWILVDVYYCVFFVNQRDELISVAEYYALNITQDLKPVFFNKENDEIISKVHNNFLVSNNSVFLIHNYSSMIYDNTLKFYKPFLPVFVIHFILYVQNKSYKYLFPYEDHKKIFERV